MTFERLGIPQAEREYLAGVSTQFESEVVYHSTQAELDEAGIIYIDTDTALKKYPEIFKNILELLFQIMIINMQHLMVRFGVAGHLYMFQKERKYLNRFNHILE